MNLKVEIHLRPHKHRHYEEYKTPFGNFKVYKVSDGYKLHIDDIPRMWFSNKAKARRFIRYFIINRIHDLIKNYKHENI